MMKQSSVEVPVISSPIYVLPVVQLKDAGGGQTRAHLLAELWSQYDATGRLHPIASRTGLARPHTPDAEARLRAWLARYPSARVQRRALPAASSAAPPAPRTPSST